MHIIGSMELGGAQTYLQAVVPRLEERGVRTVTCTLRPSRDPLSLPEPPVVLAPGVNRPEAMLAADRLMRRWGIDLLHAHLAKPVILALLLGRLRGVPVIAHEHGPISGAGLDSVVYRALLRPLSRWADRVIANSRHTAAELRRRGGVPSSRIELLYNPVDLSKYRRQAGLRGDVLDELGLTPDAYVIGYVGRLHRCKGIDLLIEAFARVSGVLPDARLVIAGSGPLECTLRGQVRRAGMERRVVFAGRRDDVPRVASAFDVGVIPSRSEAFGLVAVEMMALGVPLIVASVGGLREIVTDQRTGLVVERESPGQVSEALIRLHRDPKLRRRLAEAGVKAAERYGVDDHADRLVDLYRLAVSRQRGVQTGTR
jgi:glycosyltransferase involved in cell wall biosynthesis